ncbi:hypothetical protein VNO77_07019 [Canavalia gladiata]|uniref:Uncharacterized protein n=1 Tax=Canavalia gladiata TaxID=3824 RepID=A0AAN9R0C8_CANGL
MQLCIPLSSLCSNLREIFLIVLNHMLLRFPKHLSTFEGIILTFPVSNLPSNKIFLQTKSSLLLTAG